MTSGLLKVEGTGNDFLLGTGDWVSRLAAAPELIRRLCHRRLGIGADGVLLVRRTASDSVELLHRNADGSESAFCGNGTRCAARVAVEVLGCRRRLVVETGWAPITAEVEGESVTLELPAPAEDPRRLSFVIGGRTLEGWLLSVGVPHVVVPVPDPRVEDLEALGPPLRHHADLGPEGANLNLVAAGGDEPVAIRTFERGVEGETLACGSGVVAAGLLVMARRGLGKIRMLPSSGDELEVEARGTPPSCSVRLTGATRIVAEITPSHDLLAG